MSLVDIHAHIFQKDLNFFSPRRFTPNYDATAETYLDVLTKHGLDMGLLVQPSFLGTDNSYIYAALCKYPEKFRGVAMVSPDITEEEFLVLHKAGFTGVRLNLTGLPVPDLSGPDYTNLLRMMRAHDWHMEIYRASADLPSLILPLLKAGVKIVIDHFGAPNTKLFPHDPAFSWLLSLGITRRVWVKISGAYRMSNDLQYGDMFATMVLPELLRNYGPEYLLWGSDWPHTQFEDRITYTQTYDCFKHWVPDPYVRDIILSAAPASLFAPKPK
jgi:predicted TIM-barrel fold metal-dependent hydrolase